MTRAASGFTLVELMITLAVLAVLIALAAPSFGDSIERARLKGAADEIVNLVNEARASAMKRNRDVSLTLLGTGSAWCMGASESGTPAVGQPLPAAAPCNCLSAPGACLVEGKELVVDGGGLAPAGQVPSIDADDIAVVFDRKRGTLVTFNQAGNVILTSASTTYQVRVDVSPLGHATACVPTGKPAFGGYSTCA